MQDLLDGDPRGLCSPIPFQQHFFCRPTGLVSLLPAFLVIAKRFVSIKSSGTIVTTRSRLFNPESRTFAHRDLSVSEGQGARGIDTFEVTDH